MTVVTDGPGAPPVVDTGLVCLVMLARFHNVAASPEQLAHEFTEQGHCFGKAELLLAAKQLGLKAKLAKSSVARLATTPLPAIARANDGGFFIIARLDDDKVLIQDPLTSRPEVLSVEALEQRWSGELSKFLITPVLRARLNESFARGAENQAFLVETVNGIDTLKSMAAKPQKKPPNNGKKAFSRKVAGPCSTYSTKPTNASSPSSKN
jgi:ABC-type bacteriocin/lantibiotic exporter with double-glycine peptidase domain